MNMENELISRREGNLLNISALVMIGILCVVTLNEWRSWGESGPLLGLLILFAVILLRLPADESSSRQIHLYLLLQTTIISLALIQSGVFIFLFFILSAQAMMFLPTRTGLQWLGLFVLITWITNFYNYDSLLLITINSLVNSAGFLFFGVFGNALARAERARVESQKLLAELQQAHQQLQEYAASAEALAVAEERNRLAREMHDTLGHRLTVSIVQLEAAGRLLDRDIDRAGQMILTVRAQLVEGLDELRRTLAAMRNPLVAGSSLSDALQKLVENFQKATQIQIHMHLSSDLPTLSEAQRLAIYRTAQEALTNAQRHASADNLWLSLHQDGAKIQLVVRDDGRGMDLDHAPQGIGLHGMRERASQLHGTFEIQSSPGEGTQLTLCLPIYEEKAYA
jgi:signal transduction histidine kinase